MRFSDIINLTWDQIRKNDKKGYSITFRQQKTQGVEVLPISDQAVKLLGETGKSNQKVFEGLTYSAYQNKHLSQWIGAAGIERNITFHSFRHTYATLQLANGTDIYTVSKLLGHRDLKTTQIYAKVIDQKKRDAAKKIKINL
jgi:integrase